jgi:predicted ATPase
MSGNDQPDVFLSYASADREMALHVADLLEAQGLATWMDRKSIAGGLSWSAEIVRGIESSRALLLLCSPAAMASPNVQQEIQLAWEARRPILPLILEVAPMPEAVRYALAGRQWIEALDRPDDAWLADILRAFAELGVGEAGFTRSRGERGENHDNPASAAPRETSSSELDTRNPKRVLISLPAQTTRFVGREHDVVRACSALRQPEVRLLTLIGPGGVGKTRLALAVAAQVASDFADGVIFVPLASIGDPELVPPTIAQALDLRERGSQPAIETIQSFLADKSFLLVLDNLEQILAAGSVISQLLAACPHLKVLATSRIALRVYGEQELLVDPLALPPDGQLPALDQLSQYDAIRLFTERARAVNPDFVLTEANLAPITAICRHLDGLPLAIELAAARLRMFSPAALLSRLGRRLALLTGGSRDMPARQQTLRNAIAWSYDLLDESERRLFQYVSIFVGGFDLAETAASHDGKPDWPVWLDRLAAAADNLRAALDFFVASGDAERSLRLATAMYRYWYARGSRREGREQFASALACPGPGASDRVRARALELDAHLGMHLNDANVLTTYTMALDAYRALGDQAGVINTLTMLGATLNNRGDDGGAQRMYDEALSVARQAGDHEALLTILLYRADSATDREDVGSAKAAIAEALPLAQRLARRTTVATLQWEEGRLATLAGDYAQAQALYSEALATYRQLFDPPMVARCLCGLAYLITQQDDTPTSWQLIVEDLAMAHERGSPDPYGLEQAAVLAVVEGQAERAARLAGAAAALRATIQYRLHPIYATLLRRANVPVERPTELSLAAAWDEGQQMTAEQAVAFALTRDGQASN